MINVSSAFPVVLEITNIEPVNFKLSFQIEILLPEVTKLIKIYESRRADMCKCNGIICLKTFGDVLKSTRRRSMHSFLYLLTHCNNLFSFNKTKIRKCMCSIDIGKYSSKVKSLDYAFLFYK